MGNSLLYLLLEYRKLNLISYSSKTYRLLSSVVVSLVTSMFGCDSVNLFPSVSLFVGVFGKDWKSSCLEIVISCGIVVVTWLWDIDCDWLDEGW